MFVRVETPPRAPLRRLHESPARVFLRLSKGEGGRVRDSGQVQAAVDQLAASLGHAVLIEDGRHRPLWWSVQGEVDTVRAHTILQRTVGPEAVALVARMRLATATGPVRTPAVPEADMQARW